MLATVAERSWDANKDLHSLPKQVCLVSTGVGYLQGALKELIVDGHGGSYGLLRNIREDALYHHSLNQSHALMR